MLKATPHKDRLTALHVTCLRFFRHLAQKLLVIRQYACVVFIQSDGKIDCASAAQSLRDVALIANKYSYHSPELTEEMTSARRFAGSCS